MGNWIPNDQTSFVSQLLKISSSFTPPRPRASSQPGRLGAWIPLIIERLSMPECLRKRSR